MHRIVTWWFVLGLGAAVVGGVQQWWPLSAIGFLAWAVLTVYVLLATLWYAIRSDRRRRGLFLGLVVFLGAWAQSQVFLATGSAADRLWFWWHADRYTRLLEKDLGEDRRWREIDGVRVVVQPGEPRRVAFPLPGGLLDNWRGVVHDPSGEAMRVNALEKWSDQWRDDPVTGWFGGDMVECRHLRDHFYLCSFT